MFNSNYKKILFASSFLAVTSSAFAGYEIDLTENDKLTFGGYIKVDARYVDGDVGYRDFWIGDGAAYARCFSIQNFCQRNTF